MTIDHILEGRISRQYHEEMIKQAQHNQLVEEAKQYQKSLRKAQDVVIKHNEQPAQPSIFQQIRRTLAVTTQLVVK